MISSAEDPPFSATDGWLSGFKKRNGIKSYRLHGESASVTPESLGPAREELRKVLQSYTLDTIYNCDETGLFFRLLPNQTLASTSMKGTKKDKERVTVLLTANASGTHKFKPLVIGRSKQPRAFGKTNMKNLPHMTYRNNKTAWMTSVCFNVVVIYIQTLFSLLLGHLRRLAGGSQWILPDRE
jgi:hypothetical protein